ncbi:MAG TPA: DUF202 domain-containing protein [Rhodocyclaceae bacterium]|nr:DUF202 domain-containing protein [Rhodocyclaceae bacterium]
MSDLNDPRVFFAAERTLLAWQRTSIALIGLGFVVERFGLFMRAVSGGAKLAPGHAHVSLIFGVLFLFAGASVALISTWQYRRFLRELCEPEIPRAHMTWPAQAMNILLAGVSIAMAIWFILSE